MPKKNKKGSSDLREEVRKEEVKERFTSIAFDLFDKGADDDVVLREISVFIPNMSLDLVQRLRGKWDSKREVDREIAGDVGGEEISPPKVDEKAGSIEKPSDVEEKVVVEPVVKPESKQDPNKIEDESMVKPEPESKPSEGPVVGPEPELKPEPEYVEPPMVEPLVDEESLLLNAVEKDARHEIAEKPVEKVEDTGVLAEGKEISKPPSMPVVEAERSRDDIVRATEELRRAITSEIRAQESYEHARLELGRAKREMDVVRGELDGFKRDVDLLKKQKRVVEREPGEEPKLESVTERGKQFEEEVSRGPVKRLFENMVHKKVEEEFEKREEATPMTKLPVEEKPGEKALEKPEDFAMEKVAGMLGVDVDEARQWIDDKKKESEGETKKPISEEESVPDAKLVPIPEEEHTGKVLEVTDFYERIIRYLSEYSYVVVRLVGGKPVIYRLKLRLVGLLIGLGVGIPSGCGLVYVALVLAGML